MTVNRTYVPFFIEFLHKKGNVLCSQFPELTALAMVNTNTKQRSRVLHSFNLATFLETPLMSDV
jgi:hypothetical protein